MSNQNIKLNEQIKALDSKNVLSAKEIKKLKIQEHINTMKYIINKLDEKNDNEVEAFMCRGDEHNKLLTKLIDSIRALMRANANQCQSK